MFGVLILLAPIPNATPLLDARVAKPLDEFGACFTRAQERGNRGWAYMAADQGGTFTDSGARGAPASYWLQVRAAGAATQVRLFAEGRPEPSSGVIGSIEQCR